MTKVELMTLIYDKIADNTHHEQFRQEDTDDLWLDCTDGTIGIGYSDGSFWYIEARKAEDEAE